MDFDFSKEPGKKLNRNCLSVEPKALLSVITPYFNVGQFFEQTYNCVINQTFPYYEWIIVDDGSTDHNSLRMLDELAKTDARIRVVRKANSGPASARNEAVRNSKTDLILPLDADDLIDPTYFECLYFGLYFNPDKDWCYTDSVGFDSQQYLWEYSFNAKKLKKYNFLTYSGLIRKRALVNVGGYDESREHAYEDWHLWIKLLKNGYYPVRENFFGFWYRRTQTGELASVRKNRQNDINAKKLIAQEARDYDHKKVEIKDYRMVPGMGSFKKGEKITWYIKNINDERIHILMIIPWMEIGGADNFNLEFVRLLDKERFKVSIVLTKPSKNIWRQRFSEYVDEIYDLPSFLDMDNFQAFISYLIQTRCTKIVFLSQSYMGYSLLPWLYSNYPDICITDYMHIEEKYWRNGGYARTTAAMDAFLDRTYTCNEMTRQILIKQYGKNEAKTETVYIGVDDSKYGPVRDKRGMREMMKLPLDKKLVLFPCRMTPQKRPLLMLEIAKKLKERGENIVFVAVGDGELLDVMNQKIKSDGLKGYVLLLGAQSSMIDYYNACDLTLICSIKEGLALTAYESLACAVPVISSDAGGQKELIDDSVGAIIPLFQKEDENYNSETFSEEEINCYVEAITSLLSDEEKLLAKGHEGRKRVEKDFSTLKMVNHLEASFEELLKQKDQHKNENQVVNDARYEAIVSEYSILYSEYAKVEENSKGVNRLVRFLNSDNGKKIVKVALKFKVFNKIK